MDTTPTLYEWMGGAEALDRLTEAFYAHVRRDEVLAPVFAGMDRSTRGTSRCGWPRSSAAPRTTPPTTAGTGTWPAGTWAAGSPTAAPPLIYSGPHPPPVDAAEVPVWSWGRTPPWIPEPDPQP
ncbi:truncated hemoglobin [Streptomyces sp. NPDC085612]|uniref:truncated hemoglobin n=1 Tax=Streptomyces sp. NPDC085612 TaxID=3365732 RepID=UPI0037D15D2A